MTTELVTQLPLTEAAMLERSALQRVPAGRVLFSAGEPASGIYIVHSGSVDLLTRARNGALKRERSSSPGEILGLGAVVSCRPYDYTARVVQACELGFIDQHSFLRMLEENPSIWPGILRLLSEDVNASYQSLRWANVAHP